MNKIILMGRLTQDPEVRHTQSGKCLCNFRIAVNRRYSKQGEGDQADFFSIVAWEKIGEFCSSYFRKGQQVAVIGRLQNRSWNDEQGNKRSITEVVAEETFFADSKKMNSASTDLVPSGDMSEDDCDIEGSELPF